MEGATIVFKGETLFVDGTYHKEDPYNRYTPVDSASFEIKEITDEELNNLPLGSFTDEEIYEMEELALFEYESN